MKQSSERQNQILEFIKEFMCAHSYSPTVREIGIGVGLNSTSTVVMHLSSMKEKGLITYNNESPRTIVPKGCIVSFESA